MKTCFKCLQAKPLSEFYSHPGMRDGTLNKCKLCACGDVRSYRLTHDSVREYDRVRYQTNTSRRKTAQRNMYNWRKQHPEKYLAHVKLNNAVRNQRIIKQPCAECGSSDVHAHHDDYRFALRVVWLCPRHHALLHAEAKR